MENSHFVFSLLLLLLPLLVSCTDRQVYIVYFGEHSGEKTHTEIEENHRSYLLSVKENEEEAKSSLVYSYKNSINGFSALLTKKEAAEISEMVDVVSVFESHPRKYTLHTTRSWQFSGVHENKRGSHLKKDDLLLKSKYGRDIIVGMLDNGIGSVQCVLDTRDYMHYCGIKRQKCIWPESKSFHDKRLGPVPKSWKGICQEGDAFNSSHCNRKIIGARYYINAYQAYYGPLNRSKDYLSPRDKDGHGTHTASTVAGRRVPHVSAMGGFAVGTASGGAPLARLAIYKVCWPIPNQGKENGNTCFEADMLAAMDDAIGDGVHVMSISIGTREPTAFSDDGLAIGALHAVKNDIVVACSAGNNGPGPATLSNPAPWIITISASSIDREFDSAVALGNGLQIPGQTVTPYKLDKKLYPLVRAAQVVNSGVLKDLVDQCLPGSLSPEKATGKIIFCMRGNGTRVGKGVEVKRAGGIGYILGNSKLNGDELTVDSHFLPATGVTYKNSLKILEYIRSEEAPMAYILPGKTVLGTKPAPYMASFTSRGPNIISPHILKPDITAPGLNILAAWSEGSSPTKTDMDKRVVKYNILSGTSMACPHIGGTAALLKAVHPDWSSAAIRSALITTAGLRNNEGKTITDAAGHPADPFQFGGGHFRPAKAVDPGLVYDASYMDHLLFLCSTSGIKRIAPPSFVCPAYLPAPGNLNYPSLQIPELNGTVTVLRTVTNVGSGRSIYFASVNPPPEISVKISPPILHFKYHDQKRSFTITVRKNDEYQGCIEKNKYFFGWYRWSDGIHNVKSPMAITLV